MTNVNFALSSALQSQLQQSGVYAYAVSFYTPAGGSSTAGPTSTLVSNGVIQTANLSMAMPTNFPSGVVYVVIQQGGTGSLLGQLTTVGSVNPASAAANNYSYQLFEASLTPSVYDQGDISSVNTFGFPSSLLGRVQRPDPQPGLRAGTERHSLRRRYVQPADRIDGAAGVDTAMTWEPSRNFTVTTSLGSSLVAVRDKVGPNGTDTLLSIEHIRFGDRTIDTGWIAKTAAQAPSQIVKVVDL